MVCAVKGSAKTKLKKFRQNRKEALRQGEKLSKWALKCLVFFG
jgi:hypothetical protein